MKQAIKNKWIGSTAEEMLKEDLECTANPGFKVFTIKITIEKIIKFFKQWKK